MATGKPFTQIELEQRAGQRQVARSAERLRVAKRNRQQRGASVETAVDKLGVLAVDDLPIDPAVKFPANVANSVRGGEAAFDGQERAPRTHSTQGENAPRIITSVIDDKVQERRDANLRVREQASKRGRRQPPKLVRLEFVTIAVDRLLADGMPFGVGPNSKMNKTVRAWLNDKAKRACVPRPSRHKEIGATAVREVLRQFRNEGAAVDRNRVQHRRTTQEEARERLKELRARKAGGTD